jgi:hypothetical protein
MEFFGIVFSLVSILLTIYGFLKLLSTKPVLFWLDPKAAAFFINDVFVNPDEWNLRSESDGSFESSRNTHNITFDVDGYRAYIQYDGRRGGMHQMSPIFQFGIRNYNKARMSTGSLLWESYDKVKSKRLTKMLDDLDEAEYQNLVEELNKSKSKVKS